MEDRPAWWRKVLPGRHFYRRKKGRSSLTFPSKPFEPPPDISKVAL
jgi:hypothetical protein